VCIKVVQDRFQWQAFCEEGYGHSCLLSGGEDVVDELICSSRTLHRSSSFVRLMDVACSWSGATVVVCLLKYLSKAQFADGFCSSGVASCRGMFLWLVMISSSIFNDV
jgi:hypothetical protein